MRFRRTLIFAAAALQIFTGAASKGSGQSVLGSAFGNEKETEILTEDFTPKRGDNVPLELRESTSDPEKSMNEKTAEPTAADALDPTPHSWYCMHKEKGERPPLPPEMKFIEKYGGYYLGKDDKVIYLTFDAGYENGNIEKILDVLKAENVQGAFFILENLVKQNTELVVRMAEEGHTVCNHTARHGDMTKIASLEAFKAELEKMDALYKEYTGYEMADYYRPPEGKFNEQNLAWADQLGYKTIFWSYAYADWDNSKQMQPDKAKEKVLSGTHNGEIILLHPTSATNAEILGDLIKSWKEMGYRFGSLDELTGKE